MRILAPLRSLPVGRMACRTTPRKPWPSKPASRADTITRLAHEIAAAESGAVVIAGAPLAQTNGMFNALAVNALEALVESGHSQPRS